MGTSTLFDMFGKPQVPPNNRFSNLVNQFNSFKRSFQGDPRQRVQELLDTGQMTQQQFNQLSQVATQFQNIMRGF